MAAAAELVLAAVMVVAAVAVTAVVAAAAAVVAAAVAAFHLYLLVLLGLGLAPQALAFHQA